MYAPRLGRFLSQDPIGLDGGDVNLLRYVGNDPVNATDPSGLWGVHPQPWVDLPGAGRRDQPPRPKTPPVTGRNPKELTAKYTYDDLRDLIATTVAIEPTGLGQESAAIRMLVRVERRKIEFSEREKWNKIVSPNDNVRDMLPSDPATGLKAPNMAHLLEGRGNYSSAGVAGADDFAFVLVNHLTQETERADPCAPKDDTGRQRAEQIRAGKWWFSARWKATGAELDRPESVVNRAATSAPREISLAAGKNTHGQILVWLVHAEKVRTVASFRIDYEYDDEKGAGNLRYEGAPTSLRFLDRYLPGFGDGAGDKSVNVLKGKSGDPLNLTP